MARTWTIEDFDPEKDSGDHIPAHETEDAS